MKYQPVGSDDLYTLSFFTIDMENLFAKENSLVTDNFYKGVGGMKSRGVELEARVNVTEHLRVLGSVTLNDVKYSKSYFAYNSAGEVVDAKAIPLIKHPNAWRACGLTTVLPRGCWRA